MTKQFSLGTLYAGGSFLTVFLLMLGNQFLVLTFLISIVYAVVPISLWRKHQALRWRIAIGLTCVLGFGVIIAGALLEAASTWLAEDSISASNGYASPIFALVAGFIFLPLACFGSLHSFLMAKQERRQWLTRKELG